MGIKLFLLGILALITLVVSLGLFGEYIFVISGILIFLVLIIITFFVHKAYEKFNKHASSTIALGIAYLLIIINIVLSLKFYSVEWAFLGFLIIAIILYDFKIDSRFLILPALILLGYIPFLLIGYQQAFAETIAIFVYYFLVVGIGLQIVEYIKNPKLSLDFTKFTKAILNKDKILNVMSVWGIVTIAAIITNRFIAIELLKWSFVYIFVLLIVSYGFAHAINKK